MISLYYSDYLCDLDAITTVRAGRLINIPCQVADTDMVTTPKMEIIYIDNLNYRINNWEINLAQCWW